MAVSPKDRFTQLITKRNISWKNIHLSQHGMNPFEDLKLLWEVIHIYRQERPDIVSHFTVKCVLYGSIAAHFVGVRRVINNITGLGFLFNRSSIGIRLLRGIIMTIYRLALKDTTVIFQNHDDLEYFIRKRIVKRHQAELVSGSGVTIPEQVNNKEPDQQEIKVILPGRMIWPKGIQVFVDAAQKVRATHPNIHFILVGAIPEHDRSKIPQEEIDDWCKKGWVEWWGWQDDMSKIYQQSDIICMPTLYGEGIPKTLVEGAAYKCALIATDSSGCREIVHHGENGFLVPPNDATALGEAIIKLAGSPELLETMGMKGQQIVKDRFTTDSIINRNVQIYLQAK